MKKIIIIILAGCSIFLIAESCHKCTPLPDPCIGVDAKFAADIQPIIATSCSNSPSCHRPPALNNGIILLTYNQVINNLDQINSTVGAGTMPPPPATLSDDDKLKISCWIKGGAPNN
jgi:hypothetical protein